VKARFFPQSGLLKIGYLNKEPFTLTQPKTRNPWGIVCEEAFRRGYHVAIGLAYDAVYGRKYAEPGCPDFDWPLAKEQGST